MPSVSIITPTWNCDDYLSLALESAREARRDGAEHLVIDGAASDDTARLVSQTFPDVLYERLDSNLSPSDRVSGPAAAVNRGLERAGGELVGWLNADDLYVPASVRKVRECFAARPELDVVYGTLRYISQEGQELQTVRPKRWHGKRLGGRCFLHTPAVFFRRRLMDQVGPLDTALKYWEEYDLWLRMQRAGATFARLDDLLALRRARSDGRRVGNPCPVRQAAVLREFCEVQARQLRRVGWTLIMEYAVAQAVADRWAEDSSQPLRSAIVDIATAADQQWNGTPRRRRAVIQARAAASHAAGEVRELLKTSAGMLGISTRSLRQSARRRYQKLFLLRQQAPQPVRLPDTYHRTQAPADPPSISIVTPSYNQAEYLGDTIRSVLDQRYPRLEYIIQDGASTDRSVEVIRQFEDRLAHWESRPDNGQAHAINCGMRRTTGEILAYLNSDDLLLPGSLAYVARYFQRNPKVDVVYGHRILIDAQGRQIGRWILPAHDARAIHWADYIPQETMFWRRRAWERVGAKLDESFQFALDWDLILRFQQAGVRFARLPRFLGAFRVTAQQKTSQAINSQGLIEMTRLRQRVLGFDPPQEQVSRALRGYLRRHRWHEALYSLGVVRY